MGLARQLTADEIFEQVQRFAAELQIEDKENTKNKSFYTDDSDDEVAVLNSSRLASSGRTKRLSNVVFMGMGEPLANYRPVRAAIKRLTSELGIGARRITVSTVGVVPKIQQLMSDPEMPPVRLAVSLHCATDEARTALLPANARYGGLANLWNTLGDYIDQTKQRITLEWALIENENDDVNTARQLGHLITKGIRPPVAPTNQSGGKKENGRARGLRKDMVHVNVIPLNPTGGYLGSPSSRLRVDAFCRCLEEEFGIACTPRVRRGIDIDAGCGQLKSKVLDREMRQPYSNLKLDNIRHARWSPMMMNSTMKHSLTRTLKGKTLCDPSD
jgi:23S rRNA (adenine2503-C2)-methyltransferase